MPQIICRNVSLGYGDVPVVENLNFEVSAGDYLCIIGANGAGKTTLMKTLLHFREPLRGSIEFSDDCRPKDIGYLPQQTELQKDFPASVSEIVISGCQGHRGWRPFYNRDEKNLAQLNMVRLRIADLSKKCFRELSGGQQQRVMLARALCATQKLLLMDEPVSGLDPQVTTEFYQLISDLNRSGITIIMITHDLSEALPYASHVFYIGKKNIWMTQGEYMEYRKNGEVMGGQAE